MTIDVYGFVDGMNTNVGLYDLGKDQYSFAQNVELFGNRIYKKNFQKTWQSNPSSTFGPRGLNVLNGALITAGDELWRYIGGWSSIIGGTGAFNSTPTRPVNSAILNNRLLMCCETHVPLIYNDGDASATNSTAPINASCCAMVNNYMFIGLGDTVYWSAVSDPTTWPSTNFITIRGGEFDSIRAIVPFGTDVIVFKRYSMYRIFTNNPISTSITIGPVVCVNEKIGCAGANCVDRLPDGRIVWVSQAKHCYIYDGAQIVDISDPLYPSSNVQNMLDTLDSPDSSKGNAFYFGCVRTYPLRNQVLFSAPLSTGGPFIYTYDYRGGFWVSQNTTPYLRDAIFSQTGTSKDQDLLGISNDNSTAYAVYYLDSSDYANWVTNPNSYWEKRLIVSPTDRNGGIRSGVLNFYTGNTASTYQGTVQWGYNGTSLTGTTSFSKASATAFYRFPFQMNTSSGVPAQAIIRCTVTTGQVSGSYNEPLYLSDQVSV